MNYIYKEHSLITKSLFPRFLTPLPLEPPLPLRKIIVKFRFHSFHSEIKDQLILNQQLFKKNHVVLTIVHINITEIKIAWINFLVNDEMNFIESKYQAF